MKFAKSKFISNLENFCQNNPMNVTFAEYSDLRILQTIAHLCSNQLISKVFIPASESQLGAISRKHGIDLASHANMIITTDRLDFDLELQTFKLLSENAAARGKEQSASMLKKLAQSPLYQSGYLLKKGHCDAALAGCVFNTGDVIRAAISTVGTAENTRRTCGAFIMHKSAAPTDKTYIYADCAVNIEPDAQELVDIAYQASQLSQAIDPLVNECTKPRVGFLSFSTQGSASHPRQKKMAEAALQFLQRYPSIPAVGEVQFDAAIIPEIAKRKCPDSTVAGTVNVFIFPDLDSGNIAYKMTQRLAGYSAYGPILLGLDKPYSDLSRGASVPDIISSTYINLIRARSGID